MSRGYSIVGHNGHVNGGSRLFNWRQAIAESDLRPTVRLVAMMLSLHMNDAGGSCWPSVPTIARECGLHPGNVRRALYELRDGGWLDIENRTDSSGRKTSNFYVARVPLAGSIPGGDARGTARGDARGTARGMRAPPRAKDVNRGRQLRTSVEDDTAIDTVRTPRRADDLPLGHISRL